MPSSLLNIFIKEVKELLRDPKILVGTVLMPLIMFIALGGIFSTSISTTREASKNISIIVVDQDMGTVSNTLKAFLQNASGFNLKAYYVDNLDGALSSLSIYNASGVVLLPQGLSYNITNGVPGHIRTYVALASFSLVEQGKASIFESFLEAFDKSLSVQIISSKIPSTDPNFISNPISSGYFTYFKGKVLDVSPQLVFGALTTQITFMPIIIMIMIFTTMTMASTAVAIEKETKTLETLLTLPVNRLTILIGKLSGSLMVAILGTITYIIGFNYYMNSLTSGLGGGQAQIDLANFGISITLTGYLLLGVIFFISILAALALAVSFSVFSEDVRSAQTSVSYIYVIILIPTLLFMFMDLSALPFPMQVVLLIIPFTHTMLATKDIIIGNYSTVIFNILYLTIFSSVVLYIAAKLFTTEKVFTTKLTFRRRRKE